MPGEGGGAFQWKFIMKIELQVGINLIDLHVSIENHKKNVYIMLVLAHHL